MLVKLSSLVVDQKQLMNINIGGLAYENLLEFFRQPEDDSRVGAKLLDSGDMPDRRGPAPAGGTIQHTRLFFH